MSDFTETTFTSSDIINLDSPPEYYLRLELAKRGFECCGTVNPIPKWTITIINNPKDNSVTYRQEIRGNDE